GGSRASRASCSGLGEVGRPIVVQAHKFSKSALEKIQAAGGRAEVIGGV
ncbi:MAG: uL15m family ribosomal protein, partial [Nitrospirota bacterium]